MASKNIRDCVPELQEVWPKLFAAFEKKNPGLTLNLTCTHRTPEEQYELYKQGRTNVGSWNKPEWVVKDYDPTKDKYEPVVTNCDGDTHMSPHNYYPARAFDVVVVNAETHTLLWDDALYMVLPEICEKLNVVSGGVWNHFKDWPHVEIRNYRNYKPTKKA